ncbi:hypothetical protein WA577_002955 [Blastocystis sp. JDR]
MESPSKSIHESEPSLREADSPLSEEEANPSASTKESVEVYLFRLIMQMLQAGAVDKSKLTPNLQKQVDVMESIRQNMEDTSSDDESRSDLSSDEYTHFPIENELEAYFLNRKKLKQEFGQQEYNPVSSDVSDFSITDVSDSGSSDPSLLSDADDIFSPEEETNSQQPIPSDNESIQSQLSSASTIQSQLSSTSASSNSQLFDKAAKSPSLDIQSTFVKQCLSRVGNENVIPSVFDPNNRGVDFFLLPIFYTPQLCGSAPDTSLRITTNQYIADRYLILSELGSATFSITVKCVDMRGDASKHLCLKIIKNGDLFLEQSLDEIRVLRYLNKLKGFEAAHLLRLHDFFFNKQHLMIVTELLQQSLYDVTRLLDDRPQLPPFFTLARVRVILKQILEALEFIHSHNIVHCDLKPENILFQDVQRAQIKLVDFGGSNFITSLKSLSPRQLYIQSRSYRAPEIILGTDVDERIDMWSLGCIAAELYTHRLLFDNSSVANLLTSASALLEPVPECLLLMAGVKVLQSEGRFFVALKKGGVWDIDPPHVSLERELGTTDPDFVDFVRKLLRWDPNQRLTASQALQHPFIAHERPDDDMKESQRSGSEREKHT